MGEHIQGSEPGDEDLRRIKVLENLETYITAVAAKHFRLIVTNEGKLLF